MKSNEIKNDHITTDDLAFSAYLKMKGYHLIKSDQKNQRAPSFLTSEQKMEIR